MSWLEVIVLVLAFVGISTALAIVLEKRFERLLEAQIESIREELTILIELRVVLDKKLETLLESKLRAIEEELSRIRSEIESANFHDRLQSEVSTSSARDYSSDALVEEALGLGTEQRAERSEVETQSSDEVEEKLEEPSGSPAESRTDDDED